MAVVCRGWNPILNFCLIHNRDNDILIIGWNVRLYAFDCMHVFLYAFSTWLHVEYYFIRQVNYFIRKSRILLLILQNEKLI